MLYFSTLLIVIVGFFVSSVGRPHVVRLDRLHSFWRFTIISLIANLAISQLEQVLNPVNCMGPQIWGSLIGGIFQIFAIYRLAQSLLDFEFRPPGFQPENVALEPKQDSDDAGVSSPSQENADKPSDSGSHKKDSGDNG